jgi:ParB-like chromosome segregation protein Spo0J
VPKHSTGWRNRIVEYTEVAPDQLLANPLNYRVHPRSQQDALKGVISDIGFIDPVIVQQGTDTVIDGHLRVTLALRDNIPTIPVQYVDLTDAEAAEALATIDPLSAMAVHDADKLRDLLDQVSTGDAAVMQMLSELAEDAGVVPDFAPVGIDEQGRLDEKAKITCPECGHEF